MAAIPQVNYAIDQQGKKVVQINIDDWEKFCSGIPACARLVGAKKQAQKCLPGGAPNSKRRKRRRHFGSVPA